MNSKRNYSLLIVDDEQNICRSLKRLFRSENIDIDSAYSGEEALERVAKKNYDLILTDYRMQGIQGIEFIRELHHKNPKQKVVLMSAFLTDKMEEIAEKFGAIGCISKPFPEKEAFLEKLDDFLELS